MSFDAYNSTHLHIGDVVSLYADGGAGGGGGGSSADSPAAGGFLSTLGSV